MKTNEKFRTEMWKDKAGKIHIVNRIPTIDGHHMIVQKPDGSQEPETFISSDELEKMRKSMVNVEGGMGMIGMK